MLAELGLEARYLREFTASKNGIRASVIARDEAGKILVDGDMPAVHEVFIPFVG